MENHKHYVGFRNHTLILLKSAKDHFVTFAGFCHLLAGLQTLGIIPPSDGMFENEGISCEVFNLGYEDVPYKNTELMPMARKPTDFRGQNIYVGIDVHKKSFTVSVHGEGLFYKTFSQPADGQVLVKYLHRNFPGASYSAVYEAGFSGFWLQEFLESNGVNCIVVNPIDVPTTDKEKKQKRDRIDSHKLARSLKNGDLEGIYIPAFKVRQDRNLLRTRQQLVSDQTRCKNRIKSMLSFFGISIPEQFSHSGRYWSHRFMAWLKEVDLREESGNISMELLLKELLHLRELILRTDRAIWRLSKSGFYRDQVELLLTVPGVGRLTSMILLTELGNVSRFKSLDRLCSYFGLIPNVYGSGDTERIGEITKRGNGRLKRSLIESSWVAIRNDPALGLKYQELCTRMKGNKAIIRIARKLLNRIRYVLLNNTPYQMGVAA